MNSSKLNNSYLSFLSTLIIFILLVLLSTLSKAEEVRSFTFDIKKGQVEKKLRTIKVNQGDKIELNWKVDQLTELHLHGYDIKLNISPGQPEKMIFEAQIAGRFPVGIHGSGSHGKIIYLEIYPR
jgi:hypothetical protein